MSTTKKKFEFSINSPLPTKLAGECKKAAKILNSFIDPGEGVDKMIPSSILQNAQGLAIFTVLKAGFLFSGRAGSGLVVARLADGTWSAPSCIVTGGIGAGGQIGAELTDFVLVLNNKEAVKTFSHFGNITLGGNVSIAAGPIGRNAEASGSATFKHVSAIYSYSRSRGLFAGVSLEGSVIVTRNDANEKLYGERFTAKQILNGTVPPPREADSLYRALNAKFHTLGNTGALYQRIIQREESMTQRSTTISAPGTLKIPPVQRTIGYGAPNLIAPPPPPPFHNYSNPASPVVGNGYVPLAKPDYPPTSPIPQTFNKPHVHEEKSIPVASYNYQQSNFRPDLKKSIPPPLFEGQRMSFATEIKGLTSAVAPPPPIQKAKALYSFVGEQPGDLSFEAGDVILVTEKTDNQHEWWTGKLRGATGSFPANYVELR